MADVKFSRFWNMPSKDTFEIPAIKDLLTEYVNKTEGVIIDPFCNGKKYFPNTITNDLDETLEADYHLDAIDFLRGLESESVHLTLYDPPYSPRQVSECYKRLGKTVNMETTQASYWGDLKKEIARVSAPNAVCVSFGWNSGGIGKKLGFVIEEILLVAHGGNHNDTICTVDRKTNMIQQKLL